MSMFKPDNPECSLKYSNLVIGLCEKSDLVAHQTSYHLVHPISDLVPTDKYQYVSGRNISPLDSHY